MNSKTLKKIFKKDKCTFKNQDSHKSIDDITKVSVTGELYCNGCY